MTHSSSNLALLIDADNVSYRVIAGLITEIADHGTASVRRIYGDWTGPRMDGWKRCLLEHSITPIQQFAYTTGKNATDGAMIIDAMDLLYTGRFSGFCIVSSDSDFTRLASRIREQGVTVYGFGERKTPYPFVAACNKFVYFDALSIPASETKETLAAKSPPLLEPELAMAVAAQPETTATTIDDAQLQLRKRPLDRHALNGIKQAVINNADDDGYASLALIGSYLIRVWPDLTPRNYGYQRLKDFLEASGLVVWRWIDMGDNRPPVAMVCLKKHGDRSGMPRR
jgi:hypothetical protein